jgi:hypothetical protein
VGEMGRVNDTIDRLPFLSAATPSLGAAERVGPIIIEHCDQRCLGAMGLIYPGFFPRKAVPNVVYVPQHAPTTSVPLNPPAARGWQVVLPLV